MDFSSDTSAPAHPKVLDALAAANQGMAQSYGADDVTARLQAKISEIFETETAILPVVSGTAANALSLSLICRSDEGIFCHEEAHIERDERGAPEFYTGGGKLKLLQGAHGRITGDTLREATGRIDRAFVHDTPPAALSLTNLTECGTAYRPEEIAELTAIAMRAELRVHMDGARFANALVSTGATPANLSWHKSVNMLSLGLTKGGAMGCEVICLFDGMKDRHAKLMAKAKRGGHLPPKMRFLSAQALALLEDNLWLDLARQANARAKELDSS